MKTLDEIHRQVYQHIGDELLWGASMPWIREGDESIPVARYGSSNVAQMKTIYRYGLGNRYGRLMQTIAGIHYNFSMPSQWWPLAQAADGDTGSLQDYITKRYLGLIRNFRRHSWLLIYLFGASPAVCASFLRGRSNHRLIPFKESSKSLHAPFGTSLRMGDLGYTSNAQKSLNICYNTLDSYVETLKDAITRSHPAYEKIGLGEPGHEKQLSTSLLQIENEFYSTIRPKRVARSGEIPLGALRRGGIEYIEVRCVDVNPFLPLGIDAIQMRFLDTFLLHCLLQDSPPCSNPEAAGMAENVQRIVEQGRDPELQLLTDDGETSMRELANGLLAEMLPIAQQLDASNESKDYRDSHQLQVAKVADPRLTPSAEVLAQMEERELPFFRLAMAYTQQWADDFRSRPLSAEQEAAFEQHRQKSLEKQGQMEAADSLDFQSYLRSYYSQYDKL